MRKARMCYDHLAGELGVAIADALQEHHHIELADDGGVVTETGEAFFRKLGIDITAARGSRRACVAEPDSASAVRYSGYERIS